jgi:hypothetical protein
MSARRSSSRIGCRINPAWEQKFRVVSSPKTTKIVGREGTKSGPAAETRLAGDTG